MNRSGIIAGGNWLIDHIKVIDAWPAQDSLVNILSHTACNGGGPYNVLKALAKLRAPFPLLGVGLLGEDADGRAILADCAAHGIDTAQLHGTADAATSYTDVMTTRDDARRTFFHDRGTNALLAPAHFDFSAVRAKHFHLAYLLILDALDALGPDGCAQAAVVLRAARAAGLTTSLDCVSTAKERFRTVVAPVLPEVDVLFANDFEAEQLTGVELGRGASLKRDAVEHAARALITLGVRAWAIVHFPEGVCACSAAGEIVWQAAVRVPSATVAGTSGAGDALAAGILLAQHEGRSVAQALELGVCAAAASLRSPTCSDAIVPAEACLVFGRGLGFHSLPA